MAEGVLIFEGMRVGVLPGDLKIEVGEDGSTNARLILSTAYNVLPIWCRVALDDLRLARQASDAVKAGWSAAS